MVYVVEPGATNTWKAAWQKLSATGAALTDPVVMPGTKNYPGAIGGVAFDADTVVALLGDDNALDTVRIGPTGAIVTAPVAVAKRPFALQVQPTDQLLARRGTEAVVGWTTEIDIRLARVLP